LPTAVDEIRRAVVVDTETTGLDPRGGLEDGDNLDRPHAPYEMQLWEAYWLIVRNLTSCTS
jgi:hypothetical protein